MLLIIECKYKLLERDKEYSKRAKPPGAEKAGGLTKMKNANGHTYVELKCSDDDEVRLVAKLFFNEIQQNVLKCCLPLKCKEYIYILQPFRAKFLLGVATKINQS